MRRQNRTTVRHGRLGKSKITEINHSDWQGIYMFPSLHLWYLHVPGSFHHILAVFPCWPYWTYQWHLIPLIMPCSCNAWRRHVNGPTSASHPTEVLCSATRIGFLDVCLSILSHPVLQWRNGYSVGLAINRWWVQILPTAKAAWQPWASCSRLCAPVTKQHNLVPATLDALRLGR